MRHKFVRLGLAVVVGTTFGMMGFMVGDQYRDQKYQAGTVEAERKTLELGRTYQGAACWAEVSPYDPGYEILCNVW